MKNPSVVFITGASSGIGEALARIHAAKGDRIVICARRKERLERLAEELGARCEVLVHVCDVGNEAQVRAAAEHALARFGQIDIVYANAGSGRYGKSEELTAEIYEAQFRTNTLGAIHTVNATRAAIEKSRGRIAIVGTAMSFFSLPYCGPYTISKFALRAYGETLQLEMIPLGVSVTMIYPGIIGTEFRWTNNKGDSRAIQNEPVPKAFVMSVEKAAKEIVAATLARRRQVILTFHAKFGIFIQRHFPSVYFHAVKLATPRIGRFLTNLM